MKYSPSKLRVNIYSILDGVLETGTPIEVERNGEILVIMPKKKKSRLSNIKPRNWIVGDPHELTNIDWSSEWSELKK